MNRYIWLGVVLAVCSSTLQAEVPFNWGKEELLARRLELRTRAMNQTGDSSAAFTETQAMGQKSIGKAVVFSAVVPGTGQFYAKSYVKAAVFLAVEVTAWAVYFSNTKKGDKRDGEFKQYAGENWNESRYWSYVNWVGSNNEIYSDLVVPEDYIETVTAPNGGEWHLINEQYYQANRDEILAKLREIEQNEFSHRLPSTTTQQYYEMIGKYPGQFGNAWSDASFDRRYSGPDNITSNNNFYMETREEANRYYDYCPIRS